MTKEQQTMYIDPDDGVATFENQEDFQKWQLERNRDG